MFALSLRMSEEKSVPTLTLERLSREAVALNDISDLRILCLPEDVLLMVEAVLDGLNLGGKLKPAASVEKLLSEYALTNESTSLREFVERVPSALSECRKLIIKLSSVDPQTSMCAGAKISVAATLRTCERLFNAAAEMGEAAEAQPIFCEEVKERVGWEVETYRPELDAEWKAFEPELTDISKINALITKTLPESITRFRAFVASSSAEATAADIRSAAGVFADAPVITGKPLASLSLLERPVTAEDALTDVARLQVWERLLTGESVTPFLNLGGKVPGMILHLRLEIQVAFVSLNADISRNFSASLVLMPLLEAASQLDCLVGFARASVFHPNEQSVVMKMFSDLGLGEDPRPSLKLTTARACLLRGVLVDLPFLRNSTRLREAGARCKGLQETLLQTGLLQEPGEFRGFMPSPVRIISEMVGPDLYRTLFQREGELPCRVVEYLTGGRLRSPCPDGSSSRQLVDALIVRLAMDQVALVTIRGEPLSFAIRQGKRPVFVCVVPPVKDRATSEEFSDERLVVGPDGLNQVINRRLKTHLIGLTGILRRKTWWSRFRYGREPVFIEGQHGWGPIDESVPVCGGDAVKNGMPTSMIGQPLGSHLLLMGRDWLESVIISGYVFDEAVYVYRAGGPAAASQHVQGGPPISGPTMAYSQLVGPCPHPKA
jgi:hypothetical protein